MGTDHLLRCQDCKEYRCFTKFYWPSFEPIDPTDKPSEWDVGEMRRFFEYWRLHDGHHLTYGADHYEPEPEWREEGATCLLCKADKRPWNREVLDNLNLLVCGDCWKVYYEAGDGRQRVVYDLIRKDAGEE